MNSFKLLGTGFSSVVSEIEGLESEVPSIGCAIAKTSAKTDSSEPEQYPPEPESDYFPPGFDQIDEQELSSQPSVRTEQPAADFMLEAQKLVDAGEATSMTEAMQKVARQRPELHEAFKAESRSPQSVDARQFKSNKKFVELSQRCRLTLDQAAQAQKAGHPEIAQGTLAVAEDICREIRQLLAE